MNSVAVASAVQLLLGNPIPIVESMSVANVRQNELATMALQSIPKSSSLWYAINGLSVDAMLNLVQSVSLESPCNYPSWNALATLVSRQPLESMSMLGDVSVSRLLGRYPNEQGVYNVFLTMLNLVEDAADWMHRSISVLRQVRTQVARNYSEFEAPLLFASWVVYECIDRVKNRPGSDRRLIEAELHEWNKDCRTHNHFALLESSFQEAVDSSIFNISH